MESILSLNPRPNVARTNMVNGQIRPSNIRDPRISAVMRVLPREDFVPAQFAGLAYMEADVPVSDAGFAGRSMMEPRTLARLIDLGAPRPGERVLDVGCMSGYSAALLACLCNAVTALEADEHFIAEAKRHMQALTIKNVTVGAGDLEKGYPQAGPYDLIFFDGALRITPSEAFFSQLNDGGRLVCIIDEGQAGQAHLFTKVGDKMGHRIGFDARVACLPGFLPKPVFRF